MLVLLLAGAIWLVDGRIGTPVRVRFYTLALLYVAVLALHLTLPDAHPLRLAAGGSAASWLLLGGAAALVFAYRRCLGWLRARAGTSGSDMRPAGTPARSANFSDTELNRYARHIVLRELGGTGQKRLRDARVLVIGAGGLGAPVLQYLAAAGVGTIGVIDDDTVENANLQRQVIHIDQRIGMPKVFSAQAAVEAQNPFVTLYPYHRRLTAEIAGELFAQYDLIIDGCDNFETRYLVNAAAVAARLPVVSGALSQWEGQLSVFDPANGAPCYRCVFPAAPAPELAPSCAEAGVLGPLPGVIGTMMAVEAIKLLTGAGQALRGQMLIYDSLYGENRAIAIARNPACPDCSAPAPPPG